MKQRIKGMEINYELEGPAEAPVVTCSHCLAGDLDIWRPQVEALRGDYRVLRMDIRGHGGSEAPEGGYSMEMLAEDVLALLDALGLQSTHFMGISLGGMIGQTLALESPERVQSLVLCDTTCRVPPEAEPVWRERMATAREKGMEALAEETLDRWLSPGFRLQNEATARRIKNTILSTSVQGFIGCCQAISAFDVKERLPGLRTSTLVMVGEHDPGTPVDTAREIQSQIDGAELAVLPDAYHLSNIEAAEAFNQTLTDFLGRNR